MAKQSSLGRVKCPHCRREVPITRTENYWYHVSKSDKHCTKGQRRNYCTGSGEPISMEQHQKLWGLHGAYMA